MTSRTLGALAVALLSLGAASAQAEAIVSAVSVVATNSFPDSTFGNATNLINQGGLATNFVSGTTNFDSYMAGSPQHTILSPGAEWFTDFGATGATLTFDLGSAFAIDRVATWVDEFWGVGSIAVFLSLDNSTFNGVGSFAPTDWALSVSSYGADIFSFSQATARYIRLDLSGCPQPLSQAGGGCGMGEVAFRMASQVPEPGTLALLGLGIAGLGLSRRRKAG